MKTCSKCKIEKSLEQFSKRKYKNSVGHNAYCKSCMTTYQRAWQKENPDKVYGYSRKWIENNRDKWSEITKNWRSKWTPERRKHYLDNLREWRKANPTYDTDRRRYIKLYEPEKYQQLLINSRIRSNNLYYKDWYKSREQKRRNSNLRRARLLNAFVELVQPKIVWDRDGGICGICNKPVESNNWHLEHKIPLSKGGEHSYRNVQVSHPICNWQKHVTIPNGA